MGNLFLRIKTSLFGKVAFIAMMLLTLSWGTLNAKTVTGKVVSDADNEPLIGATVAVQGVKNSDVITDYDGKFSVEANDGQTLVVSYIGFVTKTVRVSGNNLVISLESDDKALEEAVAKLPKDQRVIGAVTKTTAQLYLSKAYLTYAWWLENPNNIDTYPATSNRDKSKAQSYFQKAYDVAVAAIKESETSQDPVYYLQETFLDVNFWQNDRNAEWLLWADHTVNSDQYNGGGLGWGNGAAPDNFAGWFTQWNYCGDMKGYTELNDKREPNYYNPVLREACQALGRPWTRMAPIPDALKKFTNVDKDSRWDGTFTYQYRVNMAKGGNNNDFVYGAGGSKIKNGEVFLQFLPYDAEGVVYDNANGMINAGYLEGHPEFVINISDISRQSYPGVWKHIGHRTDRSEATELGNPNGSSSRPFVIAKFSEFFFIAAEANVKGANATYKNASDLLKVIRGRAGKWKARFNDYTYLCSNTGYDKLTVSKDYSQELMDATPSNVTIEYILDERLREYWGEGYRWFDLARTQTWEKLAGVYHISDANNRNPVEHKRDIKKHYYLRPIPQGMLDALQMTPEEKAAYQNPGY